MEAPGAMDAIAARDGRLEVAIARAGRAEETGLPIVVVARARRRRLRNGRILRSSNRRGRRDPVASADLRVRRGAF